MDDSEETTADDCLLELEDIHMEFGKVSALAGISLKIK